MSTKIHKPHTGKTRNDVAVRYSDRCFPYARLGKSGRHQGMVGFFRSADRPPLDQVPTGTLIVNLDTGFLEISMCDPAYPPPRWLAISGGQVNLGIPTDGTYLDGILTLSSTMSIADAVDALNEQLLICCNSGSGGPSTFASHIGTTDGDTNGFLVSPSFVLGRVASPTTSGNPFYTDGWDDDTNRDLTDSGTFSWELSGGEKVTDLHIGTITVDYITQTGTLHTEILSLNGGILNQSSSPSGFIDVTNLVAHPTASGVVEGFVSVEVPINTLLGSSDASGKLDVEICHEVTSGSNFDQLVEFFKDGGPPPSVSGQAVYPENIFGKYLSGVQFLGTSGGNDSSLTFVISSLDIWEDTYRADPLLVDPTNYGIPSFTVPYNSGEVTKNGGASTAPFTYNHDFVFSGSRDITLPVLNPDQDGIFQTMTAQVRDPFNNVTGPPFSGVPPFLINSFPISSTDTLELFVDEEYRLDCTTTGSIPGPEISGSGRGSRAWDSTETLVSASGLQVVNGALIFPQDDWSIYEPSGNPDYTPISGLVGPEGLPYCRQYRSTIARTNGVLRIEGMTELDRTSKEIIVEIRVVGPHDPGNATPGPGNTGTGWLSLNDPYNFGSFAGDDGDGCFVTTGGFSAPDFEFTLGSFSTGFSENMAIEVRVTYPNTISGRSKRITRMEITNW